MEEKGCEQDFLFLGSPLLDITTCCSREELDKWSLRPDDCIRETEKQEDLFRLLLHHPRSQTSAGGSAQNTARIAKWILGDRRNRVSFAGCVSEDEYKKTLLERLQAEGVEALYIPVEGESTGICACLLSSEGERSMCARLGAAALFSEHHLRQTKVWQRVEGARCIFVEGYFLAHSPDVLRALADTCSETQVLSISLSAEYICRDHAETLVRILPRVDVLFSNEAEAKVLAETLIWTDLTVEGIAQRLSIRPNGPPRTVVVTRGPNPVLVARGAAGPPLSFPVPEGSKMVDSVGCGDALAGAFLAVFVLTGDVSLAARTGISAALEIAQVAGCRPTDRKLYPQSEHAQETKSGRPV